MESPIQVGRPVASRGLRLMALCLLCGGLLLQASARTVQVDWAAGDDARDGSAEAGPVRTLARGLELCAPGDVLSLRAGQEAIPDALVLSGRGGLPGRPLVVEGNGAVLTGLRPVPADAWQNRGGDLWFYRNALRSGSSVPHLAGPDGVALPAAARAEGLAPGHSFWDGTGVVLRCAAGQTPPALGLRVTAVVSGAALNDASYVTVRNLTCEHFANDGFNVHGRCQGLVFEGIVGRHNGDDGFSVHEDVGVTVQGGWFFDNTFGIQDVNLSRSLYAGVLVERNRAHGAHFCGGAHSLVDAVVRDNGAEQVRVDSDPAPHMGVAPGHPFTLGTVYLSNTVVLGGRTGILAGPGTRIAITACHVARAGIGVQAQPDAVLHLNESVVADCGTTELECASALCRLDGNAYWPGRITWLATPFAPDRFDAYRKASGQDRESVLAAPVFSGTGFRLAGPLLIRSQRLQAPGLTADIPLPFGEPLQAPRDDATAPTGSAPALRFDFEGTNPWCRVYPVPEKGPDGKPVSAHAELSTEQAVSGTRSVRLEATLPGGGPAYWQIKLFSVRLYPCTRPIRSMRFQLWSDGNGTRFCPRVRDSQGDSFAGPEMRLDWRGWREVAWDLQASPPTVLASPTGNGRQDGPPLEVILDLYPAAGPEGGQLVLFADDLEILPESP